MHLSDGHPRRRVRVAARPAAAPLLLWRAIAAALEAADPVQNECGQRGQLAYAVRQKVGEEPQVQLEGGGGGDGRAPALPLPPALLLPRGAWRLG